MNTLWDIGNAFLSSHNPENNARSEELVNLINTHGLAIQVNTDGYARAEDSLDSLVGLISGAENAVNQHRLTSWLSALRTSAQHITRAQFRHRITPFVQADNRSVQSALRNAETGVYPMLKLIVSLVGRDVKHPLRLHEVSSQDYNYGYREDVTYRESETGNLHTLQSLQNRENVRIRGGYVEDTPASRRYLRYIDFLAQRFGIRVLYCPKDFAHLEEITTPAFPSLSEYDGELTRNIHSDNYHLLYVAIAFDRTMFESLLTIETDVQPGQQPIRSDQIDYAPIFVDNLESIITVITTLGSFAACKIYYKAYRTQERSSPAARS